MIAPTRPIDCCDGNKGKCTKLSDCYAYRSAINNRLVLAEDGIVSLDSRMDTAESTITNHGTRLTTVEGKVTTIEGGYVTKGTAQSITGAKTFTGNVEVPDTTASSTGNNAVNSDRLMTELSGYVTLGTTQTISGSKTFSSDVYTIRSSPANVIKNSSNDLTETAVQGRYEVQDKNGYRLSMHRVETSSSGGTNHTVARLTSHTRDSSNNEQSANVEIHVFSDGSRCMTIPWRAYSTSNTNDAVSIGMLKASSDVVHTSGAETVAGVKKFTTNPVIYNASPNLELTATDVTIGTTPATNRFPAIVLYDSGGSQIGFFMWRISTTDMRARIMAKDPISGVEGELRMTVSSGGVELTLYNNTAGTSTTIASL